MPIRVLRPRLYALTSLLLACGPKAAPEPVVEVAPPVVDPVAQTVLAAMDPATAACEDFYQYACGGWLKETPLPSDKPIWSRSFSQIRDDNRTFLRTLLDRAAADPTAGDEDWRKIGEFYGSCTDQAAIDAAGITPIAPLLAAVDGIKKPADVMGALGRLHLAGVDALFNLEVEGDLKDPTVSILYVAEGGLGLPERDYYLRTDAESEALKTTYKEHIARMFVLAGATQEAATKDAAAVYKFEAAMAEKATPAGELRDIEAHYNKIDRAGLEKLTRGTAWQGYFAGVGQRDAQALSVDTPTYHQWLHSTVAKTDVAVLKAYLRYHVLTATAGLLTAAIDDENFAFYGKALVGQQVQEDRWKRCVTATDNAMGEILGKVYVKERFAGASKDMALTMVKDIEAAYEQALPGLSWMDDPTRALAVKKMNQVSPKVGYPDKWRDYSALEVSRSAGYGANALAARSFESKRQLDKVGKPVDRDEWYMSPPAVNAYYHPLLNQIVFPAGILQPPFFSADFPSAMNYGAIGMVIGHELSHGFDDQGRKFDGDGVMKEWWPAEVSANFDTAASCVEKQYSAIEALPGYHIKGDLTLGENIADMGGIKQAHRAWNISEARDGKSADRVPGLTNEQLLFVAYAQGWCTVAAPQFEQMLITTNPHSPSKYRVNVPLQNLPEFHQAFSCAEGTTMHPKDSCAVW
jgi:putative endopeptidase